MSIATQTNPTDDMIERDRATRWLVAIVSPIVAIIVCWIIGVVVFELLKFSTTLGATLGLGLGFWVAVTLIKNSIIKNGAVQAVVTVDALKSLMGAGDSLVCYGPGIHVRYWWETISSSNNINLGAVTETFAGIIQCTNATITHGGEFRFRPDITMLPVFLSGVAATAGSLSSLIEAEKMKFFSGMDENTALASAEAINKHLKSVFVHGPNQTAGATDLERQYGIVIDDVTVSGMLPSKESQETRGAASEADIISTTVRSFLCKLKGIPEEDYAAAVKDKLITSDEISETRDRIMALSGNLQGMQLNRTQFDLNVKGLGDIPPEAYALLVTAAKHVSAAKEAMVGNKSQTNKGSQQKRR